MTPRQIREFDETQECQFAIALDEDARFRISAFYQQAHAGMVCRRIETVIPTFEDLGLPELLTDLSLSKRGIILFVGATGTGKSTSLASMVGYRNRRMSGHIISIEDPIEYVHFHGKSLVTHREVGIDTESFEVALRNTLRQAPDVILIGEADDFDICQASDHHVHSRLTYGIWVPVVLRPGHPDRSLPPRKPQKK